MLTIFILDGGHGPNTAGKRSPDGSLREYNFNHPTAQALGRMLKGYENTEVYFSYTAGQDTPLATRVTRANDIYRKHAADVKAGRTQIFFISIHANAMGAGSWNAAQGIETFVNSIENTESKALATSVHRALIGSTGRKDRGVKYTSFYVLRNTLMPAILVECGFMTNQEENELLKSDSYRTRVARGIANGLATHAKLKAIAGNVTPTPAPAPVTVATEPAKEVKNMDQTPSETHAEAVAWAIENGISNGANPHVEITREQALTMIYRLFLLLHQDPDQDPYPTHEKALAWAKENNITDGSRPLVDATRQQVVQMIYNDNERKGTL